jgi:peptidoglycan/xylan/chitin deacetylase (PgdA/CDA1 family)
MRIMKQKQQELWLIVIWTAALLFGEAVWAEKAKLEETVVPIVTYHRITEKPITEIDLTSKQFEQQLRFFRKSGYKPITATQLLDYQNNPALFPKKPIVITFDDGPKSNYLIVFPLLKKFGWKATFFIYPKVIAENSKTQLTWRELREMAEAGMDIQSHTLSHPFLTSINAAGKERYSKWLKRELRESKEIIEAKLNRKVDLLAYPYGWFNNYVETRCLRSGYRGVFTINYGVNRMWPKRVRFDRFVIDNYMSNAVIKSLLNAKPLEIETIVPRDGETYLGLSELKFRLKNSALKKVEVKFRGKRSVLQCGQDGIFIWKSIGKAPTGYQMVIVKAQGAKGENYLGSWGFDNQQPVVTSAE